MTHTTWFDQNKLVFQNLDAILNLELVLKLPKVYIIIGSLRFHLKVDVQVALYKNENFLEFSCFGYFFKLPVEIFYILLVDYMYDFMWTVFFGKNWHISWV